MNKKKGNTNRILAILCAITMVVTLFPAGLWNSGVYAAEGDDPVTTENAAPAAEKPAEQKQEEPAPKQEEAAQPAETTQPAAEEQTVSEEEPAQSEAAPAQKAETSKEETAPAKEEAKDGEQNKEAENKDADKKDTEKKDADKEDTEKEESFKVEFDFGANYAGFNPISEKTTEAGGKFTLPKKPEAREKLYKAYNGKEYYFTGWEYKGKEYEPGDTLTLKANAKFKAVWKQTYTIEFSAKGIKADSVQAQTEVYGESVELPGEQASKSGYDFVGWTSDNGNTVYEAGTPISAGRIQPKAGTRTAARVKLFAVTRDGDNPFIDMELLEIVRDADNNVTGAKYKVTASDSGSGLKSLEYQKSDSETPDDAAWEVVEGDISSGVDVSADVNKYVHVRAEDNDGNKATAYQFVDPDKIEDGKPIITINDAQKEAAAKPASSHTIEFSATDTPTVNSGIKKITVAGEGIPTQELAADATSVTISGDDLNGTIDVSFVAEDNAGNKTKPAVVVPCTFDTKAPTVTSIEMPDVASGAEAYYHNADNAEIKIGATDENGVASVAIVANGTELAATLKDGNYVVDASTLSDGEIAFTVKVKDEAGVEEEAAVLPESLVNVKKNSDTEAWFVLDKTAPSLTAVSTNPTGILNGSVDENNYFYNKTAKTTYTIAEANPASAELKYKKDGEEASATTFSQQGDNAIVTGDWNSKATFNDISLFVVDKAGNKLENNYTAAGEDKVASVSDGVITFSFGKIIDNDPPKLTEVTTTPVDGTFNSGEHIFDNKYYYNCKASTTYKATDDNIVSLTLTYKKDGVDQTPIEAMADTAGSTELSVTVDWDSETEYTDIKLVAVDVAGNKFANASGATIARDEDKAIKVTADGEATFTNAKVIDLTSPKYKSSGFSTVPNNNAVVDNTAYYKEAITGAFTIEETNFDQSLIKAGSVKAEGDGQYSTLEPVWSNKITGASVSGKVYSIEPISEPGVYRFVIAGEDKAGNKLEKDSDDSTAADSYNGTTAYNAEEGQYWSMIKIVDTVSPKATLTIDDYYKLILKGLNDKSLETYEPFRKEQSATVNIATEDKSPVSIAYKIRYNKKSDSATEGSWVNVNAFGNTDEYADKKTDSQTMKGEIQFEVCDLKILDRAGNETSIADTNIIYLDGTKPNPGIDVVKPQPTITATTAVTERGPNGQNLYNKSVELKFSVKDPNQYKSSSGLNKVKYTIYVDGEKTAEKTLYSFDGIETREPGTNPELKYSITENLTLDKGGKYESNRIKVVLEAEDNAGNKDDASLTLGIDSVGPKIVVSYDNNSAQNDKYFKANRTATITVTERNLGKNSDKIKIKTEVGVPGSWSYSAGGSKDGNNDKWIKHCYYTKDGDYTMASWGTDALGNPATVSYTGTAPKAFTIDKTAPIIKVTFDNNNVRNRKYYKANRKATITITEHNFRDSDVKVAGSAEKIRGGNMGFPARSGFSSRGDTRKATIPFTKEGVFSFNVNYTDLAGNPAKVVKVNEFVIDKTAPVVKIENVINGGIYGGTVAPRAVFDDDTFSKSDSNFRFTGVRIVDRSNLVPGFHANGEYGGSYTMSDFPYNKVNDDIYTAYATSTDLAGNTTTVSVTFSVNRFGSSFDYNKDQTTMNLVDKKIGRYYTNVAENLQIREINVNHIDKYTLTLDRGGNSVKLEEGKDFTVTKSEGDMGSTYIYKISKDIVTDEGIYNIVVRSEDAAGNVNTNAAIRSEGEDDEVPVRFVYDVTAPTMSFLDEGNSDNVIELKIDDKNSFNNLNELLLGIVPEDDWALGAIQFVLSNRKGVISDSGVIKGKDFWDVMGEDGIKHFLQKIGNGTDVKTLKVTVWDAAGNETTQEYRIIVTKNIGQLAIANWYWLLALLAAAGGAYAYYRKRKAEEEDDDDDDEDDAA